MSGEMYMLENKGRRKSVDNVSGLMCMKLVFVRITECCPELFWNTFVVHILRTRQKSYI